MNTETISGTLGAVPSPGHGDMSATYVAVLTVAGRTIDQGFVLVQRGRSLMIVALADSGALDVNTLQGLVNQATAKLPSEALDGAAGVSTPLEGDRRLGADSLLRREENSAIRRRPGLRPRADSTGLGLARLVMGMVALVTVVAIPSWEAAAGVAPNAAGPLSPSTSVQAYMTMYGFVDNHRRAQ